MNEYTELLKDIEDRIGEKRTKHSIRVAETAVDIIDKLGLDIDREKAYLAGLLHDCAKIRDEDLLLSYLEKYNLILDEHFYDNIELIHPKLGAEIARIEYKIDDEDILNAISFHTTGRVGMSLLEKVIFLADYIEPMRNFLGVEKARELTYKDLDEAILYSLDKTLSYLIDRELIIDLDSVETRNFLLKKRR